jgi:hypothetical protein
MSNSSAEEMQPGNGGSPSEAAVRIALGSNGDGKTVSVPIGDLLTLLSDGDSDRSQREPPALSDAARHWLLDAVAKGRAAVGSFALSGFDAWEVLWAIKQLPNGQDSEPLAQLATQLTRAVNGSQTERGSPVSPPPQAGIV